ncbi:hypothetical protein [Peribacillus kribbensis]|nr:hypothetical protein [Peribacillus kribbensis]
MSIRDDKDIETLIEDIFDYSDENYDNGDDDHKKKKPLINNRWFII